MSSAVLLHSRPKAAPKKRGLRLLVRTGVVLVVLLVAAEIMLRLALGLGSPLLYQNDPDCGYMPQPNQDIKRFFSHNYTNEYGMRSADFQPTPAAGTLRILLIGDSVTYATTYVDQSRIWSTLLKTALPAIEHRPVEVLNMSAGGWSPGNEFGYLRSRGTFNADAVFFVVNSGDPGEEFAKIAPGDLNYPLQKPASALGETWSRYVLPRLMQHVTSDAGTTIPPADVMAQRTAANLKTYADAKAFAESHQALFGIIYIPFPSLVHHGDETPHDTMQRWAAENHVPLIDVEPRIAREDAARISRDGIHPNAEGDQVIADEIEKQWGSVHDALAISAGQAARAP